MSQYITKIRTESGDLQIDYNALANIPESDTSLSKDGKFADAKAAGAAIDNVQSLLDKKKADLQYVNTQLDTKANITYVDEKLNLLRHQF